MRSRHLTHFGVLEAESDGRSIRNVTGTSDDPDPRAIIHNVASSQHHPARIKRPAIRKGWLDGRSSAGRGDEPFVEVEWSEALDLLAGELTRVYGTLGSSAVYGASYGWSSAGRFHHGQSQVHRFLNCLGGYVSGVGDYSYGTSGALLPHVLGTTPGLMTVDATTWDVVCEHTELFISFGGLSEKNSAVGPGGISKHGTRSAVRRAKEAGCRFVDITPIRDDTFEEARSEWIAPRPGSDAALMLAIAYVLDAEGLADVEFLDRYTTGYEQFIASVRGDLDGTPKTPEWAAQITQVDASTIAELARSMARSRTMINISWSMQRQQHGEQPMWLGITLAAMIGQIGLPGGGVQHGYGSTAETGLGRRVMSPPSLPQGRNAEPAFIPVARVADMLLDPGSTIDFDGRQLTLPTIDLVYWVGGNPFHHHQDLAKLRRAFRQPSTVVVHEQFWTSTARHADIVLPATMTIERDDYGAGRNDPSFRPMPALTEPAGEAWDDYAIFAALEARLDIGTRFTEGRTALQWLEHLYASWATTMGSRGHPVPDFDVFWQSELLEIPVPDPRQVLHADFRADPVRHRLATPSGLIEIFSETIDSFGYDDCPGHPVWLEPREWGQSAAEHPLHLIANQPKTRLHSQLDVGDTSQRSKIQGREPARMNPVDAEARGLQTGDIILVRNERGSCLAGLIVSDAIRPDVVQLSAGAWYDPDPADPSFCRHGNPNVLTADVPSSRLSQGTTAQHTMVQVERWDGPLPPITVTGPPPFTSAGRAFDRPTPLAEWGPTRHRVDLGDQHDPDQN